MEVVCRVLRSNRHNREWAYLDLLLEPLDPDERELEPLEVE